MFIYLLTLSLVIVKSVTGTILSNSEREARDAYNRKDFRQAYNLYESLVEQAPENLGMLYNLGKSAYMLDNFENARLCFEQVNQKEAAGSALKEQATFQLGDSYIQLHKLDQAQAAFEQVLRLNKDNEHAQKRLELIKKLRQQEEAQKNNERNQKQSKESKTEKPNNGNHDQRENAGEQSQNNKKTEHDNRTQHEQKSAREKEQKQDEQKDTKAERKQKAGHENASPERAESSSQHNVNNKKQQLPIENFNEKADLTEQEKQILSAIEKADGKTYRELINQEVKQAMVHNNGFQNW